MPIVLTRATKQEARYKALGGAEHCSACRFYMPQGTCGRIIGPVSPEGWCKYYSREAVQRWSNPGYAGSGGGLPPGSTLNLNFMSPGTLDPLITFTRASSGTYFDSTGTMQTAAINAPRWDYDPITRALNGIWMEEARTNLLLNSATLGTQSIAVTAQAYTLSFYGTGTITKSGTATGALVGSGAFPARVTQTFTPTAGTLTLTVAGSVQNAQLEAGGFVTSYMPTAGTTTVRAADQINVALGALYVPQVGTQFIEAMQPTPANKPVTLVGIDLSGSPKISINVTGGNAINIFDNVSGLNFTIFAVEPTGTPFKAAFGYRAGSQRGVVNGGSVSGATNATVGNPTPANFSPGCTGAASTMCGYIRRAVYWGRMLTDAEMRQVTT